MSSDYLRYLKLNPNIFVSISSKSICKMHEHYKTSLKSNYLHLLFTKNVYFLITLKITIKHTVKVKVNEFSAY